MSWGVVILFAVAIAFAVGLHLAERARLRKLLDRPCAGILWHRRFPKVPHDEIRAFLKMFTDAFAFDEVHFCNFRPDEQPIEIYSARYVPLLNADDHSEFESLADALKTTYGIDAYPVWRDGMTLGDLFELTRSNP